MPRHCRSEAQTRKVRAFEGRANRRGRQKAWAMAELHPPGLHSTGTGHRRRGGSHRDTRQAGTPPPSGPRPPAHVVTAGLKEEVANRHPLLTPA